MLQMRNLPAVATGRFSPAGQTPTEECPTTRETGLGRLLTSLPISPDGLPGWRVRMMLTTSYRKKNDNAEKPKGKQKRDLKSCRVQDKEEDTLT